MRSLRLLFYIALAFFLGRNANAQGLPLHGQYFQIGEKLPPLKVSRIFEGFPRATLQWDELKGKAVVLEFWATWCVPCVNQIPHLNELAQELSHEPVVFISVAMEDDPERVSQFLKTTKVSGWVAVGMPEVRKDFFVTSFPQTYVIDREGRVAAITLPEFVDADVIHRVLAGEPSNVPAKDISTADLEWDKHADSRYDAGARDYEVLMERTSRQHCGYSAPTGTTNSFVADGCDARFLIPLAYQASLFNVVFPEGLDSSFFRVAVRIPGTAPDEVFASAQRAISASLGIRTHWELQNRPVWVLRRSLKSGSNLKVSKRATYSGLLGTTDGIGASGDLNLDGLCHDLLEPKLMSLVVDETNLSGAYDWNVKRDADLEVSLKRDLGLELIQTVRPVTMLVIEFR